MGIGSSNECQSPRCKEPDGSRCYKHEHNYSWWCKYCKQEEDNYNQEQKQIYEYRERELQRHKNEALKKEIEQKERDIREQERIIHEKLRWIKRV